MSGTVDDREITRFLNAWFQMRQIIQAANFNRFQQAGLSATQFMVLNVLPEAGGGIPMGELARRMNLKPATVAQTVDSLEQRGMVAREKSPADGRIVLVTITDTGRELQNAAAGQFRRHITELFRAIPRAQRAALIAGLEALTEAAARKSGGNAPPATGGRRGATPDPRSLPRSRPR